MCDKNYIHSLECGVSRRGLLTAVGGGARGDAVPGLLPTIATAQDRPNPAELSPKDALDLLYTGNQRFSVGKPEAPPRDLDRLKEVVRRRSRSPHSSAAPTVGGRSKLSSTGVR